MANHLCFSLLKGEKKQWGSVNYLGNILTKTKYSGQEVKSRAVYRPYVNWTHDSPRSHVKPVNMWLGRSARLSTLHWERKWWLSSWKNYLLLKRYSVDPAIVDNYCPIYNLSFMEKVVGEVPTTEYYMENRIIWALFSQVLDQGMEPCWGSRNHDLILVGCQGWMERNKLLLLVCQFQPFWRNRPDNSDSHSCHLLYVSLKLTLHEDCQKPQ